MTSHGVRSVILAIAVVAGGCSYLGATAPPSATQQAEEVAALREGLWDGSIHWKRGKFTRDRSRARNDGDELFDVETEAAYEQVSRAIRASGVPTNRLVDAHFAADGTLRFAFFRRSGGGITFVFTYIYSPGAQPPVWSSHLGPVVLTRIGDSDWWFEQSPDD